MMAESLSISRGFSFTKTEFKPETGTDRKLVIISDLHLGLGKKPDGRWHHTEDFRWPKALKGFLAKISEDANAGVDLVIAGDFLDMWQPPSKIGCKGAGAGLGCTIAEMRDIASWIVQAHSEEFNDLKNFSQMGNNRLHIIPGNHDAALLIAEVWVPVGKALEAGKGFVNFQASGIWISADGKIVVEHGHQIGNDPNRYASWPNIVSQRGGEKYVIRPLGERFVQKIVNQQEEEYPIIDNLSPFIAGIWYRLQDLKSFLKNSWDIARLLGFGIYQTSWSQKGQILGKQTAKAKTEWQPDEARKLGHKLFLAAIPEDDPVREQISKEDDIIKELDRLALDEELLSDEDINSLCNRALALGKSICPQEMPELGALKEKFMLRNWIFAPYLKSRKDVIPSMSYFIYGHTHKFEEAWKVDGGPYVEILNSGTFQRIIDDEKFLDLVESMSLSPIEGLRTIAPEKLPPFYTFISYKKDDPKPEVLHWVMEESDGDGKIVDTNGLLRASKSWFDNITWV